MDVQESRELVDRREAQLAREAKWRDRLRETLEDFPFAPFGTRVVILQRQAEHMSKGGLLLPQTRDAPLSGYVVAVPDGPDGAADRDEAMGWERRSTIEDFDDAYHLDVGDEVLFPDHSAHRISIMVGLEGEEQRAQEFLVIDARDLHGKVTGGAVESMKELVPGLDAGEPVKGEDVNAASQV